MLIYCIDMKTLDFNLNITEVLNIKLFVALHKKLFSYVIKK